MGKAVWQAVGEPAGDHGGPRGFNASQDRDPELPPPIPPKLLDVIDFVLHSLRTIYGGGLEQEGKRTTLRYLILPDFLDSFYLLLHCFL